MNILIVISSKSPNDILYVCIQCLYHIQILNDKENIYTVCIVDSDSDNFDVYMKIQEDFPFVTIIFPKNTNYEYGAWKIAYSIFSNYDIYFCIQDSVIIERFIPLSLVNDTNAFTFHHESGFHSHIETKEIAVEILNNSTLDQDKVKGLIDTPFNLAQHSSFIVTKNVINDIFTKITQPPVNKDGSCTYERIFGIYFLVHNINTFNLYDFFTKIHGNRS